MKLTKLLGDADPLEVLDFEPQVISLECGDVIIAEIAMIDDSNYCMIIPFRLFESEESDGKITLACIKMIPGSDDIFYHLAADKVVTMGSMSNTMFDFYKRNVDAAISTSGISLYGDDPELEPTDGGSNIVSFKPKNRLH